MFKSQIGGLALNRRKCSEMGPESSPGLENRPPGMPRPFPSLWDQSRGPKSATKVKKLLVWGLALGLCQRSDICTKRSDVLTLLTSSPSHHAAGRCQVFAQTVLALGVLTVLVEGPWIHRRSVDAAGEHAFAPKHCKLHTLVTPTALPCRRDGRSRHFAM